MYKVRTFFKKIAKGYLEIGDSNDVDSEVAIVVYLLSATLIC